MSLWSRAVGDALRQPICGTAHSGWSRACDIGAAAPFGACSQPLPVAQRRALSRKRAITAEGVAREQEKGLLAEFAERDRPVAGCAGDAVDVGGRAAGMIVEERAANDMTAILQQVGAFTPPWLS